MGINSDSSKLIHSGPLICPIKNRTPLTNVVTFKSHLIQERTLVIFIRGVLKTSAWHWSASCTLNINEYSFICYSFSRLLDFVKGAGLRSSWGGRIVSSARSSGSRCCLKACHFNQGCCSAAVVFWGTWQRLLTRGRMWFAMPVIGFDFCVWHFLPMFN